MNYYLVSLLSNVSDPQRLHSLLPAATILLLRDGPFEVLIDWIEANCHRPLSLSDLEKQSHYSRRSLQYAFRQRFGCGPMQYIRRQRLALAKQRLLAPRPGTTVTSVAQECGYLSVANFRRYYQQRFGETPSGALRCLRP
jgi:transcriptional regulator GlxA family with amidase domain